MCKGGCCGVMVVDDDSDVREMFVEALEGDGHTVTAAVNGRDALERLEAQGGAPCVVLLDMMMPIMSGPQFLEAIAESESLSTIPVVVVSATKQFAPNGLPVLEKPVDLDRLLTIVRDRCIRA